MKKKIASLLLTGFLIPCMATPVRADHELVMSYIESDNAPVLMDTTAYTEGEICSHGERAREGIVASAPEWYGMACVIYEAIPEGNGYEVGDLIGIYEILDTGYGRSTGDGVQSKVRADKKSRGDIEMGLKIDKFCVSRVDAKHWMERTNGKIFTQILPAKG